MFEAGLHGSTIWFTSPIPLVLLSKQIKQLFLPLPFFKSRVLGFWALPRQSFTERFK
jgi:hypothetical protein